jgi:hypothetical protein
MTHTHREFFVEFLQALRLPVRTSGLRALACVSIFESSEGNETWNNPLACTDPWPGAIPYNSFGPNDSLHVWRYKTFEDGIKASAYLYSQPHWLGVRSAIQNNFFRGPILDAFTNAYTWAKFDFRSSAINQTDLLVARLDHPLYGP